MRRKFLNIALSVLLLLTGLPSKRVHAESLNSESMVEIDDYVRVSKEVNPIPGKLNEWNIDLKVEYDVMKEWEDEEPPEDDEWGDEEPPEEDEWWVPGPMSLRSSDEKTQTVIVGNGYIAIDSIIPEKIYDPMGEGFDLVGMPQVIVGSGEVAYEGNTIDWAIDSDNFEIDDDHNKRSLHIRYTIKANETGLNKVRDGEINLATNGDAKFVYDGSEEGAFPVPTATPTVVEVIKKFDHPTIENNVEEGFYKHEFDFDLKGPNSYKQEGTFKFDGENHVHQFNVEDAGLYSVEETAARLKHRDDYGFPKVNMDAYRTDYNVSATGFDIKEQGSSFTITEGMGLVQFEIENTSKLIEEDVSLSVYKDVYFDWGYHEVQPGVKDGKLEYEVHLSVDKYYRYGGTKFYVFKDDFNGWDYVEENPEDVVVTFAHGWSYEEEDVLLRTTFDKVQDGVRIDLSSSNDIIVTYEMTPIDGVPADFVYKNVATLDEFEGGAEIGVAEYKDLEISKKSVAYEGETPYDEVEDEDEEEDGEERMLMRSIMPETQSESFEILDIAKPGSKIRYAIEVKNPADGVHEDVLVQDAKLKEILDQYGESVYGIVSLYSVYNEDFDIDKELLTLDNGVYKYDEKSIEDLIEGFNIYVGGNRHLLIVFDIELNEELPMDLDLIENLAIVDGEEVKNLTPIKNFKYEIQKEVKAKDLDSKDEVLAGDALDYSLTLKSDSPEGKEVELVEDLSGLKDFIQEEAKDVEVSFSNGQKASLQDLEDGFKVKMEAEDTVTVGFTVTLKDDLKEGQEIVNKASFAGKEADATIKVIKTEIQADKSVKDANGDNFVETGEMLEYSIKAKNTAATISSEFTIQDDLAQVTEHLDVQDDIKVISSHADVNGKKEFTVKDLKEGISFKHIKAQDEVVLSFKLKAKEDADFSNLTEIKNIAIVDGKEVEAVIEAGKKDFKISKSFVDANGDQKIQANETIQYIIKVDNTGSLALENLIVKDELKGLDKVFDINLDIPVSVNTQASDLSLKDLQEGILIKELKASQSVIFEFSLKAKDSLDAKEIASITNTASVNGKEASVTAEIISPELVADKVVKDENGNKKAEAGEKLFYTITVENKGNGISEKTFIQDDLAKIKDHIKDDAKVSIQSKHKDALSLDELMTGFNVDIDANEKLVIEVEVTLKDDFNAKDIKSLSNTAIVNEDKVKADIETAYSTVAIEKSVKDENGNNKAELNEKLTYNIKVSNTSDYDAKGVLIQDDLSLMEDLVKEASDVKVMKDGELIESIALDLLKQGTRYDIKANESLEFVFEVQLIDDEELWDQLAVAEVSNIAKANEHEAEAVISTGKPIIEVEKEVKDRSEDGLAEAGEVLNYKIIVTNTGDVAAKNVKVQDSLEDLVDHIDDHDENLVEGFVDGKSVLKSNIKELKEGNLLVDVEAGKSVEIIFSVQVKEDFDAKVHNVLTNTVLVAGKQAEVSIETGEGRIGISKEVSDANNNGVAEYGEELTYVIRVENRGTVAVKDTFVQDDLANIVDHIQSTDEIVKVNINDEKEIEISLEELMEAYHVENLEPEQFVEFTFSVTLNDEIDEDLELLNNFAVAGDYVAQADIDIKHPLKPEEPEVPETPEEPEVEETPESPEAPEVPEDTEDETPEIEVPEEEQVEEKPEAEKPAKPEEVVVKPTETIKDEKEPNVIPVSEASKDDLPPTGMNAPFVSAGRFAILLGIGTLLVANNRKKEE